MQRPQLRATTSQAAAGRKLLMLRSETAYTAAANASQLLRGPFSRLLGRRSNADQILDKATEGAECCIKATARSLVCQSKVALIPVKGYSRAGQMPSYSHHYPAEGTSHADQASREPAKCRAGRTPAGRQQDAMPAGPLPPSWSNKCRIDDGQLPVNLPASSWQSAGRAGQFTPKITRSIATILPEIRRRTKTKCILAIAMYIVTLTPNCLQNGTCKHAYCCMMPHDTVAKCMKTSGKLVSTLHHRLDKVWRFKRYSKRTWPLCRK